MIKFLRYLLIKAVFVGFVVAGVMYEIEGAKNVVIFWVVLLSVISPCMLTKKSEQEFAKNGRRSSVMLETLVSLWSVFIFVWHGWFWCAGLTIFTLLMYHVMVDGSKKYKSAIYNSVSKE